MWEGMESSFSTGGRRRSRTWRRVFRLPWGARGEAGSGEESVASLPRLPSTPQRRWRRAAARVSAPAAAARASRSSVAPGATRARLAARGAAAPGDGKVPGTSAAMPGSDTALTVDRTYSDPGRHQRCKSRVSGARGVAVGAPRGGARPGGLRLPRALTRRPRFAACRSSSAAALRPGIPAPVLAEGAGKGGVGARLAAPRPHVHRRGGAQSKARPPFPPGPRPSGPPPASVPRARPGRPVSPTATLRRPLRQGAPAARCRDARGSRHPRPQGTAPLRS